MDIKQAIKKAERQPAFLRTDEYIQTALDAPDLFNLTLEAGPNCNLKCFHCGGFCGPDQVGLPNAHIVEKALSEAVLMGIRNVNVTDGEPLRPENKDVMSVVAGYSKRLRTSILTNAAFAKSFDEAVDIMGHLRNSGLDLSSGHHALVISFGEMYAVPLRNYNNLILALKKVFPDAMPGKYLKFRLVLLGDDEESVAKGQASLEPIIDNIYGAFGKRRDPYQYIADWEGRLIIYPADGGIIPISCFLTEPFGRANRSTNPRLQNAFDRDYPIKKMDPGDLKIFHGVGKGLVVFYNGGTHFCDGNGIYGRGSHYGNVKDKRLRDIRNEMRADVFFRAYKIGSIPLLYYAAQKSRPGFKITGRTQWDVSRRILNDPEMVEGIRAHLMDNGVVETYKEYIESIDLRYKTDKV